MIAAIRSRRMKHAAGQDDGAERRVGAAVEEHVDVHGRQSAVSRHAGAMPDDAGMTLRRRQHVFDAVVDELDRPARLQGRERRVAGNHRRILLLAAEAAAGFRLHDAYAVVGEAEQHGQRAMDVVRALHRSVHRDAPPVVGRHGNDPVGLDVELLLRADPVLAFDDLVGLGQAGVEIALVDGDRLETDAATPTDRSSGFRRDTRCEHRPPAADRDRRAPGSGWARRRDESSRSARHGWSSSMSATTLRPGMSSKSTIVKPFVSNGNEMSAIAPAGIVERIVRAWSRSGNDRSSMYREEPETLSRPSLRGTLRPTALSIQDYRQNARLQDVTRSLTAPGATGRTRQDLPLLVTRLSARSGGKALKSSLQAVSSDIVTRADSPLSCPAHSFQSAVVPLQRPHAARGSR